MIKYIYKKENINTKIQIIGIAVPNNFQWSMVNKKDSQLWSGPSADRSKHNTYLQSRVVGTNQRLRYL